MIVRDEEAVIRRCLDSARGLADSYVIVDTGSVDRTCELIEAHELAGELHHRQWVNFGHNRTELMELAYDKADWLLLLDADHTVSHDGPPTLDPNVDGYLVRHDDDPSYWVKRLVSGRRHWRFEGATHEYITCDEKGTITARLDSIAVRHHGDGGHRPEKFARDLALLEQEHQRNPQDPRTTFYLASTLRDLGHSQRAADVFLKRASMNGWDEERFYALLEAGRLTGDSGLLLQAWNARPTRAEPLYEIAVRERQRQGWPVAHLAAHAGAQLPIPEQDTLFVHRWVYEWGCEFELSIAAWWTGQLDQARKATERLLACPTLPDRYRQQVIRNMQYLR